ncbi:hypothetical protein GN244_ATG01864 [Phytophthora infestans]|uniref:Uncharacterized protein n=2 Tax=Phytophthora infestans TaxID=4787 RepID=A0A833WM21_PHYIN|nr:hypothetical protein GN244_ATG01864 [Phytophthora infestans]
MKEHIREGVRSQSEESASQDHQETVKRRKMLPSASHQGATMVGSMERRRPPLLKYRCSEDEEGHDARHLPKRSCIRECTAKLSSVDDVGSAIVPADTCSSTKSRTGQWRTAPWGNGGLMSTSLKRCWTQASSRTSLEGMASRRSARRLRDTAQSPEVVTIDLTGE